jgi:catechol 2,3-dioxygenase-like lactoylglutathione lyase family enzyme
MIQARRIGHATFETADLDCAIDYYTQVCGLVLAEREPGRAFLASKIGQLVVRLDEGSNAQCTGLSFEVAPDTDFAAIGRRLREEGIDNELTNDSIPGLGRILRFKDPKGTNIELFSEWNYLGKHHQVIGVGPLKLGHVAFIVDDARTITDFYVKVLGFRVSDWVEDFFSFLRCGPDHHTVNFLTGKKTQMHHIAFEVKDFAHIQNACELFGQKSIPIVWGPLRHSGPGHNISTYHQNPDNHMVEFYTELDQMKDEALGYFEPRPWHHDTPQRPKVWQKDARRGGWGPPPTEEYIRASRPN